MSNTVRQIGDEAMKVTGARNEHLPAPRKRAITTGAAPSAALAARVDSAAFLGVPAVEMTATVQAAIRTLLGELDTLRTEVGRLKQRLRTAEDMAERDTLTPLLNRRGFLRELSSIRTFA